MTPIDLLDSLKAHKPAILAALACPAADLVQAHLDYVQDLAVFAEERRQSDDAAAELARLSANRQQAYAARTTPEFAAADLREDFEELAPDRLWGRVAIIGPSGRTVEVDTPSG